MKIRLIYDQFNVEQPYTVQKQVKSVEYDQVWTRWEDLKIFRTESSAIEYMDALYAASKRAKEYKIIEYDV